MKGKKKPKEKPLENLTTLKRRLQKLTVSEAELRKSKERYHDFFNNIEDGCFEFDPTGKLTFCNEPFLKIFGYTRKEFMKLSRWKRHKSREDAKRIFRMYDEMYRKNISFKILEYEIVRRDKKIRLFEVSVSLIRNAQGKPIGFRGICRDITERKKMEAERGRYQNFVENVEDACYEFDLKGRFTFCNEAAHRMLGYTREEYMQSHHRERHRTPGEAERIFLICNKLYRTGIPVKNFIVTIMHKDGTPRMHAASASLIRDFDGKTIGFRGIAHDVTEQKRMEEEQRRLKDRLYQAQKMEAVGTLAGGIAHDFNNLLMGIQGYASLMLLDIDPSHPHYERLKTIEAQVQSGANLTMQLLGYARGGHYEVKPINLNELISKTASMFGRTKKEVIIHQTFAKDLKNVEVDIGQMEQVLLNLFVNACQAMPGGGSIHLETENVMLDESYIEPYEIKPGLYVKLTFTDTGMGMDEKVKARIFEPFFTTKEMGHGAGLGLASVYGIIKAHGGFINVYSEKGHGTTFKIYLPALDKKAIKKETHTQKITRGKETIFIVDDEKMITDVNAKMLAGLGYKVLTAGSGQEAIEIYRAKGKEIDLVIMDMIMPGISGGVAIDKIKAINPEVKVILSSGYSINSDAKDIMDRGIKAFIQKPFLLEELSKKIREVLDA